MVQQRRKLFGTHTQSYNFLTQKEVVSKSLHTCIPSLYTFLPMQKNISEDKIYTQFSSFISGC